MMELLDAAYHGREASVKQLLDAGTDIDVVNESGYTALHWATCQGHPKVVEMLLGKGADVNKPTQDGRTALHFAVQPVLPPYGSAHSTSEADTAHGQDQAEVDSQLSLLQLLLSSKASVDVKNCMGRTPLHLAATAGNVAHVSALLDAGADIEAREIDGMTALLIACGEGHRNVAKLLLERGADANAKDEDKRSAMELAATFDDAELLKILVDAGADTTHNDSDGHSVLHLAAKGGHVELVKNLSAKGMDVNAKDMEEKTPVHVAAESGRDDVLAALLSQGADIGAVDEDSCTALHLAAASGMSSTVAALIKAGADVGAQDKLGRTPLHSAAAHGHDADLELLVNSGAKLDSKDEDSSTPLLLAAREGYVEVVEKLIALGADANAADEDGLTALHLAVLYSSTAMISALVAAGVKMDTKDQLGRTPLTIALSSGKTHLVQQLTDAGAKVDDSKAGSVEVEMEQQHKDVAKLEELLARCVRVDEAYVPPPLYEVKARKGETKPNKLHDAAKEGNMVKLGFAMQGQQSAEWIDALDNKGRTPLYLAARGGFPEVVAALLKKSTSSINVVSKEGNMTALQVASKLGEKGHQAVVEKLLDCSADPNIVTSSGKTALHLAAENGNVTVLGKLILDKRTDINAADVQRRTPLHYAAAEGYNKCVQALLSNYNLVEKNAKDRDGNTPLDLACKDDKLKETKDLLMRLGCSRGHEVADQRPQPYNPHPYNQHAYNPQPYPPPYNPQPYPPPYNHQQPYPPHYAPAHRPVTPAASEYSVGSSWMDFRGPPVFRGDYMSIETLGLEVDAKRDIWKADQDVRAVRLDPFMSDDGQWVNPIKCVQATYKVINGLSSDKLAHTVMSRELQQRLEIARTLFSTLETTMGRPTVAPEIKAHAFDYVRRVLQILLEMGSAMSDLVQKKSRPGETPQQTCGEKMKLYEEEFILRMAALEASRTIRGLCRAYGH